MSLLLLYYLGESLPSSMTTQWSAMDSQPNPVQTMMIQLMNSDLYQYDHSAVVLQYFETIIRLVDCLNFICHRIYVANYLNGLKF